MKKLSHDFITASIFILVVFGYLQGVVVPQVAVKTFQQAAVASVSKDSTTETSGMAKSVPCNPTVTKCGKLLIKKDAVPDNYQDFTFYNNVPGYPTTFVLDDDATLTSPSALPNYQTFITHYNGVYSVSEMTTPGFIATVTCTDPSGGTTVSNSTANISIYNGESVTCTFKNVPTTTACAPNTWTQKADFGGPGRLRAVGFSIGNKGYVGTGEWQGFFNDFWEYDPVADAWTQKANFGGVARRSAAGFSIGNKGYIGTGFQNFGSYEDFWEYDPVADAWTQKANFGGGPRSGASFFSVNGRGYVGMGQNSYLQDFWQYNPSTNLWIQVANFTGAGRAATVGFAIGNKGYIGTGIGGGLYGLQDFYEYNPTNDTWTQKANFGGYGRRFAAGFSIGNKGYIGTGYHNLYNIPGNPNPGGNYSDFWEYNSITNVWIQKADFGGGIREGAVGFSIGNKGYMGTGFDGSVQKKDFWEYCP